MDIRKLGKHEQSGCVAFLGSDDGISVEEILELEGLGSSIPECEDAAVVEVTRRSGIQQKFCQRHIDRETLTSAQIMAKGN